MDNTRVLYKSKDEVRKIVEHDILVGFVEQLKILAKNNPNLVKLPQPDINSESGEHDV